MDLNNQAPNDSRQWAGEHLALDLLPSITDYCLLITDHYPEWILRNVLATELKTTLSFGPIIPML
jgi:hypothetical protein